MTAIQDIEINVVPSRLRALGVAHLDQYFGEWAIEDQRFRALVDYVNRTDLKAHVREASADGGAPFDGGAAQVEQQVRSLTVDGIAVIPLSGVLMKFVGSMVAGTSTVQVRRLIRQAAADERVRAILLPIDSPGGTVSGTFDLVDDVVAAGKIKPVHAYIEDLGASAAYAVAAATGHIAINPTGLAGSIGTFHVLYDQSEQAQMEGIKVHLVKAGKFKGTGVPGTQITEEQLAEVQRIVDGLNEHFLSAVKNGRSMSMKQVRELADGRVHIAADAQALGLVDAVETYDQAFNRLSKAAGNDTNRNNNTPNRRNSMSDTKTETAVDTAKETTASPAAQEPVAATIAQIKAAIPEASSDFLVSCVEQNLSLTQVKDRHLRDQQNQIKAQQEEIERLKAEQKTPGVDAVGTTGQSPASDDGDPIAAFTDAVDAKIKAGLTRHKAVAAVVRADPELHAAYVAAVNEARQAG